MSEPAVKAMLADWSPAVMVVIVGAAGAVAAPLHGLVVNAAKVVNFRQGVAQEMDSIAQVGARL